MTDNRGSDDQRERSRSNRGIDAPVRSRSPRRSQHSPDKGSRQHHHKPRPETHRRPHSRDRSRDRHRRQPAEQAHGPAQPDDLIPRFRESQARQAEQDAAHSQRSRSRGGDRNRSPSSSRRHRSRSRSPGSSHRKRSHRERTPTRKSRDNEHEASSKKRRRHSPHHRRPESPRRHSRPHRSPTSSRADPTRPRRDSVARSPHRSDRESRRGSWDSRQADQDEHGQTSRSRTPASERRGSLPRRQGSVSHEGHPSRHDEPPKLSHARGSDNRASRPPRGAEREHLHREGSTDHPLSSRSDFEDDMGARSTHREGDRGSHSRAFHDSRGYSNSPHHRKSPSPSRGQGREPWNGSRSPHQ